MQKRQRMAPPEDNWSELNQMLTHHGFPKIEMTNIGKDAIVIDADHGRDLQQTLLRLVKECDRKQSAINDLLERNKRLREELAEQIEFSERCHREVSELQKIVGTKMAEKEKAARHSVSVNTETQLHEDSSVVENKLLHALIAEQDKQIKILQQQITLNENKFVQTDRLDKDKRYKAGLKACQTKLRDAEEKVQLLENEKHILVMELNSRPEVYKYRELQQKVKLMTAELKKFQTKLESNKNKGKLARLGGFSEKSKAIDSLTSSECRCTLKAICDEMQIYDVGQLVADIQRLSKLFMSIKKMQKALNDVVMLVNSTSRVQQPFPPLKDKYRAKHAVWCERQWYHVLPTLTTWRNNTISLEALQRELNKWQKLTSDKKEESLFPSPSNQTSVAEMTDSVRCSSKTGCYIHQLLEKNRKIWSLIETCTRACKKCLASRHSAMLSLE